ncbi:hypothetical protein DFH08DRAFT_400003 [Mycena albidolilacea]|uniref:F-box domain-containing protein n=1 Tax=Mycena albidolilacea TaxID=1033008 RepID=A0AAD6ZCN4_9AGAR|nr:hypothetical protein DFH08DRAFT_400003 [Mycena albidolilacea]
MTTTIPQELAEEILDHLADDLPSLGACSLVCRAWVFPSRSRLFKTCYLDGHNARGFRDLSRSPDCTFLHNIHRIEAYQYLWADEGRYLGEIAPDLSSLTGVRELDMVLCFQRSASRVFFCGGFVAAFPHVTRLSLSFSARNYEPEPGAPLIDTICLFPALQELKIRPFYGMVVSDCSPNAVPPRELHRLDLDGDVLGPILMWLNTSGHLPRVDSVTLSSLKPSLVPVVRAAMEQIGDALRYLRVDLTVLLAQWVRDDELTMLNLARNPNLRTLVVHDRPWDDIVLDASQMDLLLSRLTAPGLERLSLELNMLPYRQLHWAALDVLLQPTQFPRLRSVVVECSRHGSAHDDHSFLYQALPLLQASGLLRVCYGPLFGYE